MNTDDYLESRQRHHHDPRPEEEAAEQPPTPGIDLARWIWGRFVGIPITEPYDKEFRLLLLKIAAYTDEIKQRISFERADK